MRAMLLAAGLGTRMRPLTNTLAKPAIPFLNVPLLFWSLELLRELKPDRIVANLHHLPQTIRDLAPQVEGSGFSIHFTHEVAAPLGSGGALWFAKQDLSDSQTLLVANADEVILPTNPETLTRMLERHESTDALATLLTMRHAEAGTKFGGVWTNDAHAVQGFGKDASKFTNATQALHYVGVILLNKRIFNYLPEGESNLLYEAVTIAIQKGERVNAFCEELVWYETGNPKDFLIASHETLKFMDSHSEASVTRSMVQTTVSAHAPKSTKFMRTSEGTLLLAADLAKGSLTLSEINDALKKEEAFAVIGANALIQASVLNSVVLPGARVSSLIRDEIAI
jgi:mannose-1-phosphate guanylyltransferase